MGLAQGNSDPGFLVGARQPGPAEVPGAPLSAGLSSPARRMAAAPGNPVAGGADYPRQRMAAPVWNALTAPGAGHCRDGGGHAGSRRGIGKGRKRMEALCGVLGGGVPAGGDAGGACLAGIPARNAPGLPDVLEAEHGGAPGLVAGTPPFGSIAWSSGPNPRTAHPDAAPGLPSSGLPERACFP